jgi:uncharacterized protein (DUF2249 family)
MVSFTGTAPWRIDASVTHTSGGSGGGVRKGALSWLRTTGTKAAAAGSAAPVPLSREWDTAQGRFTWTPTEAGDYVIQVRALLPEREREGEGDRRTHAHARIHACTHMYAHVGTQTHARAYG